MSKLLEEARKCKRDQLGMTQLMRAVRDNNVEHVRQLFRLGCPAAVVHAQDSDGWTALLLASYSGCEAVVRELLAHGADVNTKAKNGWTPLMNASFRGHLAVVRLLCDTPWIALTARCAEMTALGWALHYRYADVAAFLRSRGAPE